MAEIIKQKDISGKGYECVASSDCEFEATYEMQIRLATSLGDGEVYCLCDHHAEDIFDLYIAEVIRRAG